MGINKTMMQYFEWYIKPEERLWNKVVKEASYLSSVGIDAIWLPPAYKAAGGKNDTGYAVYDLYDLGEFDQKGSIETKYGTKAEYINAIKTLKGNGLTVYADIVLNHKIGADACEDVMAVEFAFENRTQKMAEPKNISAETVFNFDARNNMYSDFKWRWIHFHGVDMDRHTNKRAVYKFYGKEWDNKVDKENGNYDYLMGADVDFNNVDVVEELERWGKWYVDVTHVNGFRLDAVKHIRSTFFNEWLAKVSEDFNEDLYAVGEYWSTNITSLLDYIKQTERKITLFDVPLHYNFFNASNCGDAYDMRTLLSNTLFKAMPEQAVTFVDNHDTQPGQSLYSWVSEWFKPLAYAIIMLMEDSNPCIFYGDFYGIPHDDILPKNKMIEKLLLARRYFAYGLETLYFDHRNVVGWVREGNYEHPDSGLAVIMTNADIEGTKTMDMGIKFAGCVMHDIMENVDEEILVDEKGVAVFKCKPKSVSVWIKKDNQYQ